jgi:hypothetical protein
MLRVLLINVNFEGREFSFHPLLGVLLERKAGDFNPTAPKVLGNSDPLRQILLPYELKAPANQDFQHQVAIGVMAKLVAHVTVWCCARGFLLVKLLGMIRIPIFHDSATAISCFRRVFPQKQNKLCMPRALFAAITSSKFKEHGILVIGGFLPSRSMHAWIIEDGTLADCSDDIWINYQPVAVLSYA